MITTQLPDAAPFAIGEGLATVLKSESLKEITEVATNDICLCDWGCEYIETVFGHLTDSDFWKNDKSGFLFQKITILDTIALKLYKSGVELATITDDTYGEYTNGFTVQPKYIELIIDWQKVLIVSGAGLYQLKVEQTIAGTGSTLESRKFRLLPYSDILANKTARVETYQTGNIIGSAFDYTDLHPDGRYQSFRVKGIFGNKTPKIEIDQYLKQDYEIGQIRPKVIVEWTIEARMIPASIADMLTEDNILGNRIEITDYSFRNNSIYRRVKVTPAEISDVQHFANNPLSNYFITFTNKKDNLIKSNY